LASETPQATELAQAMSTQLPPEKLATAKDLLAREQKVRGASATQNAMAMQALQEEKDGEEAL
ncbi:alginate biosynthesis protein, partial [Pseudomonas syringae pv. actinidiae]|nr:alginate biosynthesis protein [Pseudomonas syringae pv. actinidiae]